MEQENNINQFENYKQAIEAAYPDIIGEDGFAEPDFEGLDILREVNEKKLIQIFSDAHSLPEFKVLTQQVYLVTIEEEKRKQEEWGEQQLQEQFEEQEKMDEVYANMTVDGNIWNLKTEDPIILGIETYEKYMVEYHPAFENNRATVNVSTGEKDISFAKDEDGALIVAASYRVDDLSNDEKREMKEIAEFKINHPEKSIQEFSIMKLQNESKENTPHLVDDGKKMEQSDQTLEQALEELQQFKALSEIQSQQIAELIGRYTNLEEKHQATMERLETLSKTSPLTEEVKAAAGATGQLQQQIKTSLADLTDRLIKTSKLKSQVAIKVSLKTLRIDRLLASLSSGLNRLGEKLGQLEQGLQRLGVEKERPIKTPEVSETTPKPEPVVVPHSRVRVGERRPEFVETKSRVSPTQTIPTDKLKTPEDVQPLVKEESKQTEQIAETPPSVSKALPEDFRSILENMWIPIDAAHKSVDELGNPVYSYRANQKVEVPGVPLEAIQGLDSSAVSNLMDKDLVDRLMDGRLSVDKVFTEEQKTQMVANYSKKMRQPNAFEQRASKAALDKKEQKAHPSQEIIQNKHRSK